MGGSGWGGGEGLGNGSGLPSSDHGGSNGDCFPGPGYDPDVPIFLLHDNPYFLGFTINCLLVYSSGVVWQPQPDVDLICL